MEEDKFKEDNFSEGGRVNQIQPVPKPKGQVNPVDSIDPHIPAVVLPPTRPETDSDKKED